MSLAPPTPRRLNLVVSPVGPSGELARLRRGASIDALARANGPPPVTGRLRTSPADFQVKELLSFELSGAGEHLYWHVRKTGHNTQWIASQLAQCAGIRAFDVGYAGLKDRHAVADQWFSLYLPGSHTPDFPQINGLELLGHDRHRAKLRRGQLAANRFRIRVRELTGDMEELTARLRSLSFGSVPNYFGAQRFGRDGDNVALLFAPGRLGRKSRGFGLSAVRSAMFNGYLETRVIDRTWSSILPGEVPLRGKSESVPAGPLFGAGINHAADEAGRREEAWFAQFPESCQKLSAAGLGLSRRSLCLQPEDFAWHLEAGTLTLSFSLPRGTFATAVLRELGQFFEVTENTPC